MKDCLQHAKCGLNLAPNTANPSTLGLRPRLSLATVLARWCQYLDSMLLRKHWLKCRTMKSSITQYQQIVRLLEHRTHRRGVVQRCRSQQPIVYHLTNCCRDVQVQAEQLGSFAASHTKRGRAVHRPVVATTRVGGKRHGRTIKQAYWVIGSQQSAVPADHTPQLIDEQAQDGASLVERAIRRQMRKQRRVVLAQERQSECFVTAKPGVDNQGDRNHLTITKGWLWTAASPGTITLFE